jgi:cell wall-associated NlpC family hydrolase
MAGPATDWIAGYIGIPYLPGGRTRAGLDCWGLVVLVARERFGLELPGFDTSVWATRADSPAIAAVAEEEAKRWQQVEPVETAQPGDVLLMRNGRYATHAGICVTAGRMLHVERGIDSALDSFLQSRHRPRLAGAYRWQGAAHA